MADSPGNIPSAVVPCPRCGRETRVPESLFGTAVRCRECQAVYIAPTRGADGQLGPAILPPDPPQTAVRFRDSPLLIPGLLLFLVGTIGALFEAGIYYTFEIKKDETLASLKESFRDPNNKFRKSMEDFQGRKIEADELTPDNLKPLANHAAYFFPVNLLVVAGSVAVLLRRGYRLAQVGAGAAVVNIGFACCFLSGPIGLFALVKLFDPDSKELFH